MAVQLGAPDVVLQRILPGQAAAIEVARIATVLKATLSTPTIHESRVYSKSNSRGAKSLDATKITAKLIDQALGERLKDHPGTPTHGPLPGEACWARIKMSEGIVVGKTLKVFLNTSSGIGDPAMLRKNRPLD